MKNNFFLKFYSPIVILLAMGGAIPLGFSNYVQAAEQIDFVYSPIEESLKISSLEKFVADGTIDKNLEFYLNIVKADEERIALFRQILTKRIDIDPVVLSRLLKTDEGDRLLNFFGNLINIQGGGNGKIPLRGAIITAALDKEEGLTLLNFLRNLSVDVQIDVQKAIAFSKDVEIIIDGTKQFVDKLIQLSAQEAQQSENVDFSQLPDLRKAGNYAFEEKTWNLNDSKRNRKFYVTVFQPQQWREGKTPVVIFSHGLTSSPADYTKKAKHLASYGYFVIMPQHIGSDNIYAQEFKEGYYPDVSDVNEFINRPLDISYTLDELERRNQTEFESRLDLENVGIYGHSYGGYTALAIAGATPAPNFEQLERDCGIELSTLNMAMLLQCTALNLEAKSYDFRDERVKAVIVVNPVNASIYGKKGMSQIKIPVGIGAGSYDPITPFVFEQLRSFEWITAPEKYLFLEEGRTHTDLSQLDGGASKLLNMLPRLTLPSPNLLSEYSKAMMLAFYEVYVAQNSDFRPYLNPSYPAYLSENEEFKAYLITGQSSQELQETVIKFKQENPFNTFSPQ